MISYTWCHAQVINPHHKIILIMSKTLMKYPYILGTGTLHTLTTNLLKGVESKASSALYLLIFFFWKITKLRNNSVSSTKALTKEKAWYCWLSIQKCNTKHSTWVLCLEVNIYSCPVKKIVSKWRKFRLIWKEIRKNKKIQTIVL